MTQMALGEFITRVGAFLIVRNFPAQNPFLSVPTNSEPFHSGLKPIKQETFVYSRKKNGLLTRPEGSKGGIIDPSYAHTHVRGAKKGRTSTWNTLTNHPETTHGYKQANQNKGKTLPSGGLGPGTGVLGRRGASLVRLRYTRSTVTCAKNCETNINPTQRKKTDGKAKKLPGGHNTTSIPQQEPSRAIIRNKKECCGGPCPPCAVPGPCCATGLEPWGRWLGVV